jgi:hypothetical protein
MCEICNGSHVMKKVGSFSVETLPCPICGPIDPEVRAERDRLFEERLAAAEMKFKGMSA